MERGIREACGVGRIRKIIKRQVRHEALERARRTQEMVLEHKYHNLAYVPVKWIILAFVENQWEEGKNPLGECYSSRE